MTTTYEWTAVVGADARFDHVRGLVREVRYRRSGAWGIRVMLDDDGTPTIQVGHLREDMVTGEMGWGFGGRYRVAATATDSEIVQAVFGLFKAYEEHETREAFEWRGRRIFGPHIDIRAMHEIAERTDARKPELSP